MQGAETICSFQTIREKCLLEDSLKVTFGIVKLRAPVQRDRFPPCIHTCRSSNPFIRDNQLLVLQDRISANPFCAEAGEPSAKLSMARMVSQKMSEKLCIYLK